MSDFLLVAPGNWVKVDIDLVLGAGFLPAQLVEYDGPRASSIYELTDAFRALGIIAEPTEVVGIKYLAEFHELWAQFS